MDCLVDGVGLELKWTSDRIELALQECEEYIEFWKKSDEELENRYGNSYVRDRRRMQKFFRSLIKVFQTPFHAYCWNLEVEGRIDGQKWTVRV